MIRLISLPVASGVAAGGAGAATNNASSSIVVTGKVLAIHVDYQDTPPATTDVTIATAGTEAPAITLLTLTDVNTDGWYFPRAQVHDLVGAGKTYDGTRVIGEPIPIHDHIKVTIAQANAADYVDVTLLVED